MKARRMKHERLIRVGLVLPVTVEMTVGTNDDLADAESDWTVLTVRHAACEATPRMVEENMRDDDAEIIAQKAAEAEDR